MLLIDLCCVYREDGRRSVFSSFFEGDREEELVNYFVTRSHLLTILCSNDFLVCFDISIVREYVSSSTFWKKTRYMTLFVS